MGTQPRIRINTDARIQRESISEDQHCVIVDNFLRDPHVLVEIAARQADAFSMPKYRYPGLLLGLDDSVMTDIYGFIRSKMTKQFPFLRGDLKMWTFLSMVTLQPDELAIGQRHCHTDYDLDSDRIRYAALVYLFENEDLGGTSFFSYLEKYKLLKQVEDIAGEDLDKARTYLLENFPTYRKPARYMTGSNEIAELLCTIPARFNRLIFYSGQIPHSAAITSPELLSKDFRKGRLTLNVFADVLPK